CHAVRMSGQRGPWLCVLGNVDRVLSEMVGEQRHVLLLGALDQGAEGRREEPETAVGFDGYIDFAKAPLHADDRADAAAFRPSLRAPVAVEPLAVEGNALDPDCC